jgi:hypothetical protein
LICSAGGQDGYDSCVLNTGVNSNGSWICGGLICKGRRHGGKMTLRHDGTFWGRGRGREVIKGANVIMMPGTKMKRKIDR